MTRGTSTALVGGTTILSPPKVPLTSVDQLDCTSTLKSGPGGNPHKQSKINGVFLPSFFTEQGELQPKCIYRFLPKNDGGRVPSCSPWFASHRSFPGLVCCLHNWQGYQIFTGPSMTIQKRGLGTGFGLLEKRNGCPVGTSPWYISNATFGGKIKSQTMIIMVFVSKCFRGRKQLYHENQGKSKHVHQPYVTRK